MKKKLNIILIVTIFFIAACCKEQIPAGLILKDAVIDKDTTYMLASVPTAEPKRVFIEEFTGVGCPNCPKGAAIIKGIQNANANRVYVAKVHSDFLAVPLKSTDLDLRCPSAQALDIAISNSPKPAASIDRKFNAANPNYVFTSGLWTGLITNQLALISPINLSLKINSFNTSTKEVKLQSTATFTGNLADSISYHIYILENDVKATQDSAGVKIDNYHHEEVLREIITPLGNGQPWLNNISPKTAGLEAIKISTFNLPTNVVNAAKCVVLVAIQNNRTKEMIQVNEVKLQ